MAQARNAMAFAPLWLRPRLGRRRAVLALRRRSPISSAARSKVGAVGLYPETEWVAQAGESNREVQIGVWLTYQQVRRLDQIPPRSPNLVFVEVAYSSLTRLGQESGWAEEKVLPLLLCSILTEKCPLNSGNCTHPPLPPTWVNFTDPQIRCAEKIGRDACLAAIWPAREQRGISC